MRVFQNFGIYPTYLQDLHSRLEKAGFRSVQDEISNDRFIALHMLQPVLENKGGSYAIGDDPVSQRMWAQEKGMPRSCTLEEIILAQIEESGAEVFYDVHPVFFNRDFPLKLPSNIKRKIAWRAAPSPGLDLSGYDLVVCNFESILQSYRARGWKADYFYPAHDPEMDAYQNLDRLVDVVFVGTYSRHHRARAHVIDALASLQDRASVRVHLHQSRLTRLAHSPLGWIPPLRKHRLPSLTRQVAKRPVFGRDLYAAFGGAKIVINGAIDMAGNDRGNMRCWEALGCGALMLSDRGNYPLGFEDGITMATYSDVPDMIAQIDYLLQNDKLRCAIATAGTQMIRSRYSKARQWEDFKKLC